MGQKVNPNGMRIGINKGWNSNWIARKEEVATFVKEDNDIRKYISNSFTSRFYFIYKIIIRYWITCYVYKVINITLFINT